MNQSDLIRIATEVTGDPLSVLFVPRHWETDEETYRRAMAIQLECERAAQVLHEAYSQLEWDKVPAPAIPQPRPKSKRLTHTEVLSIRQLIADGATNSEIARLFGVTPSAISYIRSGKRHPVEST